MLCLQPRQIAFVRQLSRYQHQLGIFGSVGEIGVHHGKFLMPIVGNALTGEPAVAIDLFEDQQTNVDASGGLGWLVPGGCIHGCVFLGGGQVRLYWQCSGVEWRGVEWGIWEGFSEQQRAHAAEQW